MKVGNAKEDDGLYCFTDIVVVKRQVEVVNKISSQTIENKIMLWHYELGHLSFYYLQNLFASLFKHKSPSLFQCEVSKLAKHHRSHFPLQPYQEFAPFVFIHSDVWVPSCVTNISGTKWFVTFIDYHSHICCVYLLKEKYEVEKTFKDFCAMVQNQFQAKIWVLRTKKGKEYFSNILGEYLLQNGIIS